MFQPGKRVSIIGSGFGGLSLAVRLQAQGMQVTLWEAREKIGGRAYQLQDKGYTFDMGPSLITAPDVIESVFAAAGRKTSDYLDLIPLDPFYRIYFHDGTYIDYSGDADVMKQQMAQFNVRDAQQFDRFMETLKPIYDAVIVDRLGAKPFDTIGSMIAFAPKVLKLQAYKPVYSYVKKYFEDERHRFLFSFHPLFIGGNPFSAPSIYLMIPYLEKNGGVWFTSGGMYRLVESFAQVFQELGGQIFTSHPVEEILVKQGKAVGVRVQGQEFPADLVVSNADVGHTYKYLLAPEHRKKWTDRKVEKMSYTMSCYLLYLGVRKQYPNLKHHTLILSKRYRELIQDIFKHKILPDDFSMYLHAPTKTDPSMAPEGCESLYVLIPVANNKSGLDWSQITAGFTQKVMEFLEDWGLEGLREHTEVLHTFTPDDFATQLRAMYGNAFAIEPKLSQTAYFRPHNRSEDIQNLYLVGAGTHPGAGVPGVLLSAETTAHCILRDLRTQGASLLPSSSAIQNRIQVR